MKNVSLAVPSLGNFAPAAAPPFDIRTIDTTAILLKLSTDLLATDEITIYGTLDVTATPTSPNLVLLGTVNGTLGQPVSGSFLSYWPYVFIERTAGVTPTSPTSLFFACSAAAAGTPSPPLTTALPATTFFSTLVDLTPFTNPVRVGLDANQTVLDTFEVYGTDDPSTTGFAGGTLIGSLQGGGFNATVSTVLISAYQFVYVMRTGGFTAGSLLLWGANDTASGGGGGQGPLDLGSLAVDDTAVDGNIGTPPLTAAQSVDVYSSFVLDQVTPDVTATLPDPTNPTPGKVVFVSNDGATPITLYGANIAPEFGMSLQWDGLEWSPVGVGNAATTSGNAPGTAMTLGATDGSVVNLSTTGDLFISGGFETQISSTGLGADVIIQLATPNISMSPINGGAVQLNAQGPIAPSLQFFCGANTQSLNFKAPDTLAATTSWILPPADATNPNQALTSDSAGNLSFNAGSYVYAQISNPITVATTATVTTWNNILVNEGGAFDGVTGEFTAPVKGLYQVSAQVIFSAVVAVVGGEFTCAVVLNGNTAVPYAIGKIANQFAGSVERVVTVPPVLIVLAAGDVVTIFVTASAATDLNGLAQSNFVSINLVK